MSDLNGLSGQYQQAMHLLGSQDEVALADDQVHRLWRACRQQVSPYLDQGQWQALPEVVEPAGHAPPDLAVSAVLAGVAHRLGLAPAPVAGPPVPARPPRPGPRPLSFLPALGVVAGTAAALTFGCLLLFLFTRFGLLLVAPPLLAIPATRLAVRAGLLQLPRLGCLGWVVSAVAWLVAGLLLLLVLPG